MSEIEATARQVDTLWNERGLLIAILAVVISAFSLVGTCRNDSELKSWREQQESVENQPYLVLARSTRLDSMQFEFSTVKNMGHTADTLDVGGTPSFVVRLVLRNIGDRPARVLAVSLVDTVTGRAIIREQVISGSRRVLAYPWDASLRPPTIAPADSAEVDHRYELQSIAEDQKFCLHAWILYEGPNGRLYDTYEWLYFQQHPMPVSTERAYYVRSWTGQPRALVLPLSGAEMATVFRRIDGAEDLRSYKPPEERILRAWMGE